MVHRETSCSTWSDKHTARWKDGQKDTHTTKSIVVFRKFANALKKCISVSKIFRLVIYYRVVSILHTDTFS